MCKKPKTEYHVIYNVIITVPYQQLCLEELNYYLSIYSSIYQGADSIIVYREEYFPYGYGVMNIRLMQEDVVTRWDYEQLNYSHGNN